MLKDCPQCGAKDLIYSYIDGVWSLKEEIHWTNYFGNQKELVPHKCHPIGLKQQFKGIKNE